MPKLNLPFYLLMVLCLLPPAISSQAHEKGITVSATAKEKGIPDLAYFSFAIDGRGKQLGIVKKDIDKKTASLIGLFKKLGIDKKYISSSEVSIRPQYNYQTKTFMGYEVSRNVNVTLHSLENYSMLVNGAIESGITTISNISLDTKERNSLESKALISAINKAKEKANILAKSTGVKLGDVTSIRESGPQMVREEFRFNTGRSAALQQGAFEPGEISVTASVVVNYAIE